MISVETKVIDNINAKNKAINNNTIPSYENIIVTAQYKHKPILRNNIDNDNMVDKYGLKQTANIQS